MFVGLCGYTAFLIYLGKRDPSEAQPDSGAPPPRIGRSTLLVVVGLGLLVLGAGWLVDGATSLARAMGISELVIGLTIVAAGTSMPEVATSITAAFRGQRDIAVGNVVGSNIFNLLGVLGGAAAVAGQGISVAPEAMRFDVPIMAAVAVVCLPIFFTGARISRWEGALLLGYYIAYVTCLILAATQHAALDTLGAAMLWFVMPLTLLGVGLSVATWIRRNRAGAVE
jgi:cation:H+ antiporter